MVLKMLEQILERINDKGWHLYRTVWRREKWRKAVSRGPVDKLVKGHQYLVFAKTSNPSDPKEVMKETITLANRGIMPSIKYQLPIGYQPPLSYQSKAKPLSFIIILQDKILLRVIRDTEILYNDFYNCLDTLPSTKS